MRQTGKICFFTFIIFMHPTMARETPLDSMDEFFRNIINASVYIKASNTDSDDRFGSSVAVSGNIMAVGAPGEDSNAMGVNGTQTNNAAAQAGAAYVFTRTGSAWSQQAYLKASNSDANDLFGSSLAINQNSLVVGAPGEASDAAGVNGDQNNNSLGNSGASYVFQRTGNNWSQQAYLKASNPGGGDEFGGAVDMDTHHVVVGALGQDQDVNGGSATFAGAAYVFSRSGHIRRSDMNWGQRRRQ